MSSNHNIAELSIAVSLVKGALYTGSNIPLRVTFRNEGREALRILRHFHPLPVFFEFELLDEEHIHLPIPGAGKIDFCHGSKKYVLLRAGDIFILDVNLAEIFPPNLPVKPGEYSLKVTYHNQYGKNCFKGVVGGSPIFLELVTSSL